MASFMLVLFLTTGAVAKNHMTGHVTQVSATSIKIRARFRPRAPFTTTQSTRFYCGHERIPASLLQMGDLVTVSFQAKAGQWIAYEVKIEASKKACSAMKSSDEQK
jgi:hypothetical protein